MPIVTQLLVADAGNELQTIYTALPPGQALSVNSSPVVIANDQLPIAVKLQVGSNLIGNVSVSILPGLSIGSNLIGNVSISTLPGLGGSANIIGIANVSGMASSNVSVSGNPIYMAGAYNATQPTINSTCIAPAQMTTRGGLIVSTGVDTFNATINSGLPTGANVIGLINTNAEASIGAGTAPAKCQIIGGVYNTSTPTPTTGQTLSLQLDANGNLKITDISVKSAYITVIPTITAGSYTAGFVVGGIMTFANILPANLNAVLESITIRFKGSIQTTEFDVAIFTSSPTGTFTDHAAPAIASTDTAFLLGVYSLTQNYSFLGTHTIYTLDGIGTQILGTTTSLFVVVTTRSIPVANPASTTDMSVVLGTIW